VVVEALLDLVELVVEEMVVDLQEQELQGLLIQVVAEVLVD
jgi:hypothetical protein